MLGGGVGGLAAARHLDRHLAGRPVVEITLDSRDNFFLLSPLLLEARSGVLELRHCAHLIRHLPPPRALHRSDRPSYLARSNDESGSVARWTIP